MKGLRLWWEVKGRRMGGRWRVAGWVRRSEALPVGCEGVKGGKLRLRQAGLAAATSSIGGNGKLGWSGCEGESEGKRELGEGGKKEWEKWKKRGRSVLVLNF